MNACIGVVPSELAVAATTLESRPPLRYDATGTSLRRCSSTDSLQQRLDLLLEVQRGVVEVEVVVDLPVADRLRRAPADPQEMAGQELLDALEQRLAGEAELEGEIVLERVEVGLDRAAGTAAAPLASEAK